MAARPRAKVVIRAKQAALPAGFHARTGKPVPLTAVLSRRTPTVQGDALTPGQRAALTILRIRKQRRFRLHSSEGVIDKKRAIAEINSGTPLGKALVDIEQIAMDFVREEAERRRHRARLARKK